MKKALCAALALFAAACGGTGGNTALKKMNISINTMYGTPVVTWEKPEGSDLHYEVLIRTVSGEDGGNSGDLMYTVPADSEQFAAGGYLARYAQENDYYGPAAFQVTAYDGTTAIAQGTSEPVMISGCFPKEKELIPGTDVKMEDITMISLSGTGSMIGDNYHFTLMKEDGEYTLDAQFFDENGEQAAAHEVKPEIYEQALDYVKEGRIVRKYAEDPELDRLDGSDSGYQIWWDGMSELQRSWYEFLPAESQEPQFREFLKDISID